MQYRITLGDIRREATLLEIDMGITDGYINLTKRGDASLFYRSIQQLDDPRVIPDTWRWLQQYRNNLQRIDEVRAQIANQDTGKKRRRQVHIRVQKAKLVKQARDIDEQPLSRQRHHTSPSAADPLFIFLCSLVLTFGGIVGLYTGNFFIIVSGFLVLTITLFGVWWQKSRQQARQRKERS